MISKFKKTFFRYGLSNAYMLLVMLIAFVAMFKGMDMYNELLASLADKEKYSYNYIRDISISNFEFENIDFNKCSENLTSNLYFESFATLDNGSTYRFYIYSKINSVKLNFKWGSVKNLIYSNVPAVIVGKSIFESAYQKGKDYYIKINSNEYKVVGLVESIDSDYLDDNVITTYDTLASSDKNNFDEMFSYFGTLASDSPTSTDYLSIQKFLNDNYGDKVSIEEVAVDNSDVSGDNVFLKPVIAMFVFCLFNCIIAAEFYVYERREEIALRKVYGYSDYMIFKVAYLDVLKLSGLCAFSGFLFQLILNVFTKGFVRAIHGITLEYLALTILTVLASTFVIILIPILKTMKKTASDVMREYL